MYSVGDMRPCRWPQIGRKDLGMQPVHLWVSLSTKETRTARPQDDHGIPARRPETSGCEGDTEDTVAFTEGRRMLHPTLGS